MKQLVPYQLLVVLDILVIVVKLNAFLVQLVSTLNNCAVVCVWLHVYMYTVCVYFIRYL